MTSEFSMTVYPAASQTVSVSRLMTGSHRHYDMMTPLGAIPMGLLWLAVCRKWDGTYLSATDDVEGL